jgi:predicted transglutaminase-like cysteine proteinase
MYSAVKIIATSFVFVAIVIQPGADASLTPYSSSTPSEFKEFSKNILVPPTAALPLNFALGKSAPDTFSSFLPIEQQAAKTAPANTQTSPATIAVMPSADEIIAAKPAPLIGTLDEAPAAVSPETLPEAAVVTPRETRPRVEPREAMLAPVAPPVLNTPRAHRRAVRRHVAIDQIKFEGPAGAPFAHTRFCLKNPADCRVSKVTLVFRGGPIKLTEARRREMTLVNAQVNRSIIGTPMNEPVAQEQWVISPKYGDCNDFAVTKRHELLARGWPARALLLAEVVVPWGEHHVVVVVRTTEGDIVLDNLNANIKSVTRTPYQWVRVESPVNPLFWSKIQAPQSKVAMNQTDSAL